MSRAAILILAIGMTIAACTTSDEVDTTTTASPASTQVSEVSSTSTEPEPTSTTTSADAENAVVVTRDIPYVEGPHEFTVDVYAPAAEGPWPVVVAYHGGTAPNNAAVGSLGQALAAAGAVVFAPEWRGLPFDPAAQEALLTSSPCSLWFAAHHAADYGGDPDELSVFGISAGAAKAAVVGLYPPASHEGCLVAPTEVEPQHLILLEGSYEFHPGLDEIFLENPGLFESISVWTHLESPGDTEIHLLADERTLDDGRYDASTYTDDIEQSMAIRGDGFFDDAVRLGLLDDDEVNIAEISTLLEDHLLATGHSVTLTWFDERSHVISDAVIEYTVATVVAG